MPAPIIIRDGTKLVQYTGTATAVSVPNGIEIIALDAFADSNISSVAFPSSLHTIESGAFRNCKNIGRIILPQGFQTLQNGVFANCTSLSSVTIPNTLREMGAGVFAGCNNLETLVLAEESNFLMVTGSSRVKRREEKSKSRRRGRRGEG